MWIRTDIGLFKVNQIMVHENCVYGKIDSYSRDIVLEKYSDKEEALNVLDMMHDYLEDDSPAVFTMPLPAEAD